MSSPTPQVFDPEAVGRDFPQAVALAVERLAGVRNRANALYVYKYLVRTFSGSSLFKTFMVPVRKLLGGGLAATLGLSEKVCRNALAALKDAELIVSSAPIGSKHRVGAAVPTSTGIACKPTTWAFSSMVRGLVCRCRARFFKRANRGSLGTKDSKNKPLARTQGNTLSVSPASGAIMNRCRPSFASQNLLSDGSKPESRAPSVGAIDSRPGLPALSEAAKLAAFGKSLPPKPVPRSVAVSMEAIARLFGSSGREG